jgi:hypothetical protein
VFVNLKALGSKLMVASKRLLERVHIHIWRKIIVLLVAEFMITNKWIGYRFLE